MINNRYRVSYAFAGLSDNDLIAFIQTIITCLTGSATFSNLPVKLADLSALLAAFQTTVSNMALNSSPQLTALRDEVREALLDAFRKTGAYVQSVALNSLSMLLSSGFQNVPTQSPSSPLLAPTILAATNDGTTQVALRLSPVTNAKSYQIQLSTDGGKTWVNGGAFPQARRIVLTNLLPGTIYMIQAQAIGGSTGQSNWSTPISIMAT
ncbi:MAG TPA: fibronectin type III domain-containing protein [Candidatus Aquilonibacter sp.]|nr:fibronectin type III domain-containing protein [Candidatus Aquilonibacter sp.]